MLWTKTQDFLASISNVSLPFVYAGLRILLVIAAGFIGIRLIGYILRQKERLLTAIYESKETISGTTSKRMKTITNVLTTIAKFGIWSTVFIIVLDLVGINVVPLITGAGILGIGIGFGAKTLIEDCISGFFMIVEDQIRVGDVAILNGTEGLVEGITFRTITLRDISGAVHVFRNGSINTLSNMTKGWSAYVIDIGVAYKEDTDRVVEVMRQVDEEMRQALAYQSKMIEPIEIFGVDHFGESNVKIKARLKTLPNEQWGVGREYRRRLKKAFEHEGIEFPLPHRSLYVGDGTKSFEAILKNASTQ